MKIGFWFDLYLNETPFEHQHKTHISLESEGLFWLLNDIYIYIYNPLWQVELGLSMIFTDLGEVRKWRQREEEFV